MAIWKAEISYSDAAISGGSITSDEQDSITATLWLISRDQILANRWGIRANIVWHSYGIGPLYEYRSNFSVIAFVNDGFSDIQQPWTWPLVYDNSANPVVMYAADGDAGSVWMTGGTMYIEKDTVAKTIVFSTPLGNFTLTDGDDFWTTTMNPLGQIFSTDAMYCHEFAHSIKRNNNLFGQTTSETAKWFDFWTSLGGVHVAGAALTASDPGNLTGIDTVIQGTFYDGTIDDVQETLKLHTGLTLNTTSPAPGEVIHEHIFHANIQANYLDAVVDPATGVLFYTTLREVIDMQVVAGYSHDDGHSFTETMVDESPSLVFSYPSITIDPNGYIWVFYLVDAHTDRLYYSISRNKGRTWITGNFLTILNPPLDRPKARFHPTTGILYLFYYDSVGLNTYLQRIDVIGVTAVDASAVLVRALSIGPYDPYFDPNGRIMLAVRSTVDGSHALAMSMDTGNSWNDLSLGDITANPSHSQVTIQSPELGIGATAYQSDDGGGSGTFYAYLTADSGETITLGENIIITGTELQEFGFVAGPNHQFYLIWLAGSSPSLLVTCWISRDFIHFWEGA